MKETLVMAEKYEAGCGLGDMGCVTDEAVVRFFLDVMNWLVDTLAWAMNLGGVTTDSPYWAGAVSMSSFWLGIASFVGVVIVGTIGVTKGIVKGERDTITRSVLGVAFAVPSTLVSIWLVGYLLDALETLTAPLIAAAFGGDMGEALMNYLLPNASDFLEEDSAQGRGELIADAILTSALGMWAPVGMVLAIVVATFVVIAINILRNVLLQMLIAAAPLVFMMMPVRLGKEIIMSWAKVTAMVFLMKPMVIMYVAMMISGMVHSSRTVWDPEGLPYAVGLLMVIVVPFAVMGMFNFFGVDTDAGGREISQVGTRMFSMSGAAGRGRGPWHQPPTGGSQQAGKPSSPAPSSRTVQGGGNAAASSGGRSRPGGQGPSGNSGTSSGSGAGSTPGSGASSGGHANHAAAGSNSGNGPSRGPHPDRGGGASGSGAGTGSAPRTALGNASGNAPRPDSRSGFGPGGGGSSRSDSGPRTASGNGSSGAPGPDSRSGFGPRSGAGPRPENGTGSGRGPRPDGGPTDK